ncbi:amidase [Leptodontidium sp. MPI-SDFR-AT-0119]|nr:amidase [Leptodontidium sp. MPI-SDFR-AT-0119]
MTTSILRQNPNFLILVLISFALVAVSGVAGAILPAGTYPSLADTTIDTLAEGLARNDFTSVDLVKAYIARINEVNHVFHAVAEVNPDALLIASILDHERAVGNTRGSLHGIPLLLKDNIATCDRMNNTAGSWALVGAKVPHDATVVEKLRLSGAIILGKTSLSEWANWRSLNSSNGWSARNGQVSGPYYRNEDPWGSSSGSGVASALGLALACVGTETDGSIISPASFNNLVGIKPTVGLTSRHLVIPVSEHQDTVGPLARNVKDAAYILQAIAGVDPRDNYTSTIPGHKVPDYVAACKTSGLSGRRIGVPRKVISLLADDTTGPMMDAFEDALKVMQRAGAINVENTDFPTAAEFWDPPLLTRILNADFIVNLGTYLTSLVFNPRHITSLSELRDFTRSSPLESYPTRDTGLWDEALSNWNNTDPRFWPAYQKLLYYGEEGGLLGAIKHYALDAVVLPANFALDWAAAVGSPIVTVPMGSYPAGVSVTKDSWGMVESAPNIPFGLGFLGPKFSEVTLIGMAYAFEQRTMARSKILPYLSPRIDLVDVASHAVRI